MEINVNASYSKDAEISNDKVYFIAVVSRYFELPANVVTMIETIVKNEYASFRSNKYFSVNVEDMTIATMLFCCSLTVKLDLKQVDAFMKRISLNDKEYQMSRSSIERQHKRIAEKYKDADIEGLKVSARAVRIMGMQ